MKLLSTRDLAFETGIPPARITRLRRERKIPATKLGYRCYMFELSKVRAALDRLEIKAVR